MNAKKILSLVLAVALVVCAVFAITNGSKAADLKAQLAAANADMEANAGAMTELQAELDAATAKVAELEAAASDTSAADALQAQLDAANAKVAELEEACAAKAAELEAAASDTSAVDALQAQIDLYKPYYDAQVVISYDGGVIMLDEVLEQYAVYEQYYAQYGMDLVAYGMDGQIKQTAAQSMLDTAVLDMKAAELGLDQPDEETMAGLTEEAANIFESYIASVAPQFQTEEVSEEEAREQAVAYLESMDYTQQGILDTLVDSYVQDKVYDYVVGGVTVDDSDVQAAFDALVAEQEASFASDSAYNNARNDGELIVCNPEGYRAVKHVLIKFSDEQDASMNELESQLDALNAELEALSAEETEETETEPRTAEEINADIELVQASIDALYAELMPEAEEVIARFNDGAAFADLIAEYNDDPGMVNEPTASAGYAVSAASTVWDPAFTAGAMSIESVGGISEPVRGMYGIHVLYYESDIPAGPVDIETVRDTVAANALDEKISATYNDTLDSWIAELNPVYFFENLG